MPKKAARSQERLAFTLAALCGAAWIGTLVFAKPTKGRDWRGGEGTVQLRPTVVYRFQLVAPFHTSPSLDMTREENQTAMRSALESLGARAISFRIGDTGVVVEFDQSFGEPRSVTFGKPAVGPFSPLTARRVDGLDWEAP